MTAPASADKNLLLRLLGLPYALGLALAVFLLGFGLSIALPYLSLFAVNEAHMTPLQLGIFLTLNAVSAVGVSTLLARWSDRLPNRKPIVLATLAAGLVAYVLLSVLRNYFALIGTGALLLGIAAAAFPQVFSFARAALAGAPDDLPERALTVLRSVFSLAWVVGPGLGAVLLSKFGFVGVFLSTALCFLLAALPLLRVPGRRPQLSAAASASGVTLQTPAPLPRVNVWWPALAFVLYGMSMSMGMTMFSLFITHNLQGTEGQVGFLVGLCALLEIPVMLFLVVAGRLPTTERLVKGAFLLFVVHFVLVYLAQGMGLLVVAQILRAVVLAITAGLGMLYFQELMPGRFAAATTMFSNTGSIGAMLAGIVSGACAQLFGYRAVFLLCAALTFGGWVVMQTLVKGSERRHKLRAEAETGV